MKSFNLCGLGNALVDIFLELDDAAFAALGFDRGTMRLVDHAEQTAVLERFCDRDPRLVSGGSVANSVIAASQLGGRGAFIGCVGDDRYGLFYKTEFDELDIDVGNPVIVGEPTGTCVSIVTPDAERTMRTCLAVSSHLAAKHVDAERIRDSEWLFVEGYVLANPDTGQGAVRDAVPAAVVTAGPNGAFVRFGGQEAHVPAFPCEPKDLTGAGDMLAGAFLYGITHGVEPAIAVRAANFLAMKVITQIG